MKSGKCWWIRLTEFYSPKRNKEEGESMPVKSYGFTIGNLRAIENRLLKKSDFSQMAAAANMQVLYLLMKDKGIGDKADSIPALLCEEAEKLWRYITENAPDLSVFTPFLYENDFHNYKAVLKAVVRGKEFKQLLILPATVGVDALERAVKEKRFDLLPEAMRTSAAQAYDVCVQTGDTQLADCILDAGCMDAQSEQAKKDKNAVVQRLIAITVFYNNIKAALRAAKAKKSVAFLEAALTETGVISKKAMIFAALSGEEAVLDLLAKETELGGMQAAEEYRLSPSAFEKYCDDRLMATAKKCKYITIGAEPLIGYMFARRAEQKNLRIVYSGVKTGQPPEKTLERLRELYA